MRTSIEIPEEVWIAAKVRAAQEKSNLQEVIAAALREYLGVGVKPQKKGANR